VTFDPFGDFETKGYLRNAAREKDRNILRRLEHSAFTTALDDVFVDLAKRKTLTYDDVLSTHQALFDAVYPWAGEDRLKHAPDLAISKGEGAEKVRFADPPEIRRCVEWALKRGQDIDVMATNPGTVMGYLAFGHPFLDGNGRTIMVIHCVLAHRAGISIDWASTNKTEYLTALSRELKDPDQGHLDAYLRPFVGKALKESALPGNITGAPGLDDEGEDRVLGKTDDVKLKAEYEAEKLKRKEALG
jgi:cell filamentation protein